jgi:hypothetical protein
MSSTPLRHHAKRPPGGLRPALTKLHLRGGGMDPLRGLSRETAEWSNAHARPPGSITNRSLSA